MRASHETFRSPRRRVVKAEASAAWWDLLGVRRKWFIEAECGHFMWRRAAVAPKHVLCDGCMPDGI